MISKDYCYFFFTLFFLITTLLINKTGSLNSINYDILYPLWYNLTSSLTTFFPFSIGDFIYIIYPILFIYFFRKTKLRRKKLLISFYFLSFPYIMFYWSWGFNYERKKSNSIEYTNNELIEVTEYYVSKVNNSQFSITKNKNTPVKVEDNFNELRKKIVKSLAQTTKQFEIKNFTKHPIKISQFSTLLSYMGFSGYINPFTLEAHLNKNIPKISYPFTISHEIAHQYGISFENEANFFGLKNTLNSKDKVINYSGELVALQYLLYDLRLKDKNSGSKLIDKLNGGVIKNLQEKRSYSEKFKNPFEPYIKKIYDLFLKRNNQNKGIKSYNLVVNLLIQDYQSKINRSVEDSS